MQIESTTFGRVVIDHREYTKDVIFSQDGVIRKRDKSRSGRIHGHRELAQIELEELIELNPTVLVLGMGQSGSLPLSPETEKYLEQIIQQNDILLIRGRTPEIIERANKVLSSNERVVGMLHLTC